MILLYVALVSLAVAVALTSRRAARHPATEAALTMAWCCAFMFALGWVAWVGGR